MINKKELFLILNILKLKNNYVYINITTWAKRFNIKEKFFKLANVADFNKNLNNESAIYVFFIINIIKNKKELTFNETKTNFIQTLNVIITFIILKFLKKYKDIFLKKEENKLFKIKEYNYVIKIMIKSFYNFLYNLLNIKLKALRKYLNNALIKEWI